MNSYLSVGLIPIFTDAIADFNEKIDLQMYELKINSVLPVKEVVNRILVFEKECLIDVNTYYNVVKKIFDTYYSDDKNIAHIIEKGTL